MRFSFIQAAGVELVIRPRLEGGAGAGNPAVDGDRAGVRGGEGGSGGSSSAEQWRFNCFGALAL
jgi:hypothetical protein